MLGIRHRLCLTSRVLTWHRAHAIQFSLPWPEEVAIVGARYQSGLVMETKNICQVSCKTETGRPPMGLRPRRALCCGLLIISGMRIIGRVTAQQGFAIVSMIGSASGQLMHDRPPPMSILQLRMA